MAVHADGAPSKISWGWCVPKACDADGLHAFFSNMSALPPGHFDASCTSDARPALGDSGGAVFILFLLTTFVTLGIIATALDTWPGLVALFSGGPNAVAVDNAGHTAVEMSPPGLGDDGDDDELLLHVDGDDAGVREDAPAVANAKDRAKPMSFWRKLLACFSMTRNMPKLVSMAPQKGAIPSLNGIRVLSMCWVVLGHVFLMGLQVMPAKFPIQVAQGIGDPTYQMISNAFFSVDTFFFLSGFLVTYGMLKKLDALGVDSAGSFFSKFPLLQMYLHRWLRLTPLYMIVLGFFTWLMPYLYEGPFFVGAIKDSVDSCKEHWWANLLYINNFYPIDFSDGQCMGWTWCVLPSPSPAHKYHSTACARAVARAGPCPRRRRAHALHRHSHDFSLGFFGSVFPIFAPANSAIPPRSSPRCFFPLPHAWFHLHAGTWRTTCSSSSLRHFGSSRCTWRLRQRTRS